MNQHASNNSVPPSAGVDVSAIETLLNRNLPEVFGEGDPARRRSAIAELYTEDCVLYAPPGTFVGRDALDKFAGDLRATHPHYVYTPHGSPQVLHNSGCLAWGSGPKGETPAYTGIALLARVPAFFVIAKASSFAFRNPEIPLCVGANPYIGSRRVFDDRQALAGRPGSDLST